MNRGRPPKQGGKTKSYPLRLDDNRRRAWQAWADAQGVDLSDAIRDTVDAACRYVPKPS